MSKAEVRSARISDTKTHVYARDGGICQNCGQSVPFPGQLAHIVSQSEANIAKYGEAVIQHPENMELACSLNCNDALMIEGDPAAVAEHIDHVRREVRKGW